MFIRNEMRSDIRHQHNNMAALSTTQELDKKGLNEIETVTWQSQR